MSEQIPVPPEGTQCTWCQKPAVRYGARTGFAACDDHSPPPAPVPSGGGDSEADRVLRDIDRRLRRDNGRGATVRVAPGDWTTVEGYVERLVAQRITEASEQIAQAIEARSDADRRTYPTHYEQGIEQGMFRAAKIARANPYRLSGSEGDEQR